MKSAKYEMSIDLNVLNHLGINLYSNIPAVLAEAVANSWDADATRVDIDIKSDTKVISINDDGHGMTTDAINKKFLTVGYQRRDKGEAVTKRFKRKVMGRKGIGKLSLFSIADTIEVHSIKGTQKNGFIMSLPEIKKHIKTKSAKYHPAPVDPRNIKIKKGTKIILKDFRKTVNRSEKPLRTRLSRRFSIIGTKNNFEIHVNGNPITPEDRDYYHKLEYVWHYGTLTSPNKASFTKAKAIAKRPQKSFTGWIGTADHSGALTPKDDENLNRIVLLVRGKLAQENLLDSFGEAGIYANYIMGEIHADQLDVDNEKDIATSSRQSIIEDDDRFITVKSELKKELKHIKGLWTKYRIEEGKKKAFEVKAIEKWFQKLKPDDKKKAEKLFGQINVLTVDDTTQKMELFKYGILAFESLKARGNLTALENISAATLQDFAKVFGEFDDIEATLYHQIISGRIEIVRVLENLVDENALEKVIQKHIFDHLWLLDPTWERATTTEFMETRVAKALNAITKKLTAEEKRARLDIKYQTTANKHVIIELKRASVTTNTSELHRQVEKYFNAVTKVLLDCGKANESIEIVCVVGKELSDWKNPEGRSRSQTSLASYNARVVQYQQLLSSSYQAYGEFLKKGEEANRVMDLIKNIQLEIDKSTT